MTTFYATADTWLDNGNSTTNYGTGSDCYVDPDGSDEARALIKFDVSSIPSTALITSATLYLYSDWWWAGTGSGTSYVDKVLRNWVETEATWGVYSTGNNWGTAGCKNSSTDYSNTGETSTTIDGTDKWFSWDVKTIVQAWVNSAENNYGFLIRSNVTNPVYKFNSRTNGSNPPYLEVVYTIGSNGYLVDRGRSRIRISVPYSGGY